MKQHTTGIVIAHYDPAGRVAKHLRQLVVYLVEHVTPHVVFVSTGITPAAADELAQHCRVISRDNYGYDFWSYKVGLDALPKDIVWQRQLLLNSSIVVVHPELLLRQLLAPASGSRIFGLTRSFQYVDHLQSYCLLFDGAALIQSQAMKDWWGKMEPISDREQVIQQYELGLSQHFRTRGVPLDAALQPTNSDRVMAVMRSLVLGRVPDNIPVHNGTFALKIDFANQTNPTHSMWDRLFFQFGVVKIDFMRKSIFSRQLLDLVQRAPKWRNTPAFDLIREAIN
ncbi:MAG: rhamnan synthesis F family protein [Burkholderiaceae bacterium]